MHGHLCAFNGLVATKLVRGGDDIYTKHHHYINVYTEMFLQVCRDYPSLPDVRDIKAHEIRFFYDGLRAELKEYAKAKKK